MNHDPFKRWKFGPLTHGATGISGGHWCVFGLYRTWLTSPPHESYEWSLFNLVAVRWTSDRGWDLGFAKVEWKFTRARWRYMAREEARQRRAARKRFERALAASRVPQ
jgi:hypothetical protein